MSGRTRSGSRLPTALFNGPDSDTWTSLFDPIPSRGSTFYCDDEEIRSDDIKRSRESRATITLSIGSQTVFLTNNVEAKVFCLPRQLAILRKV